MSRSFSLAVATAAILAAASASGFAQQSPAAPAAAAPAPTAAAPTPDAESLNLAAAVGEPGQGWRKQGSSVESVTYVCETEACGGRGVVGVSQAHASGEYLKQFVADPDKLLPSYQYGSEESMKASGCKFDKYDVKKLTDKRIEVLSQGVCPESTHAAMTTIFDVDRTLMASVQVLTKSQDLALKLREASAEKLAKALSGGAPKAP